MFKTRWRSDKNKIKVVFRLQFQATQVPRLGWEGLVVSLVPVDGGKPTAKSENAVVVDGGCSWEKAIFETVKLSRDPKSGKINDKTYRFLLSATESPKTRLLGEATFDFASYAEVSNPFSVTLPLKGSSSNPILHVMIQRMQDAVEGRECEENEDCWQRTSHNQSQNHDEVPDKVYNASGTFSLAEDSGLLNSSIQSKVPSSSHSLHVESNWNLMKSTSFGAISALESDNGLHQCTLKHTSLRFDSINMDSSSFFSSHANGNGYQKSATNSYNLVTQCGDHRRSTTECSITSAPDASSDGSTNSLEDTGLKERLKGGSDMSSEKLKNEIVFLARQLEVSELELQALRKQVVKERRQREDLSKEFCILSDDRDTLKKKYELLKASEFDIGIERINGFQINGEDFKPLLEEMKQELNQEKNLNANLHLQLQKTQESNEDLILAVKDLEELLEQRARDITCTCSNQLSVKPAANKNCLKTRHEYESSAHKRETSKEFSVTISEHEEDEELEVLAKEQDDMELECSLEQKIAELNGQIELYKKDRDVKDMQMEQLALDFEIVKQENHDLSVKLKQSQLREQLKMQYECSLHMSTINNLEAHVGYLEKELEKQLEMFEADLACITKAKVKQEQRAIQAEEALWKTKLNNTHTAEHLQEEIKKLSVQMSTVFDSNENLTKQALAEATELRLQKAHLKESLEKANEELVSIKHQYKTQLRELLWQIDLKMEDVDRLKLKHKNKNDALKNQNTSIFIKQKALLEEISVLNSAVEELSQENRKLSEQLKQKCNLIANMKQERSQEKAALSSQIASIREEAKKSMEELINLRHLTDVKENVITILRSDMETLKVQYNGLKNESLMKEAALAENEVEKESLMKDILQLKDTLQKKEEAITLNEKKLKENTIKVANSDGETKTCSRNKNTSATVLYGSEYLVNLPVKIKNLEDELKMKDAAVESLKYFCSKKKLLGSRCGGLENGLIEIKQNGSQVVHKDGMVIDDNLKATNMCQANNETRRLSASEIDDVKNICNRNGTNSLIFSNASSPRMIPYSNGFHNHQNNSDELSSREMATLKEKNEAMEIELKEIQKRYSEISLKFAEVEGERQQLVMTIRSLKNTMKI